MTFCDIHCPFIGCASCEYAGGTNETREEDDPDAP